jgi:hypothetical protein
MVAAAFLRGKERERRREREREGGREGGEGCMISMAAACYV